MVSPRAENVQCLVKRPKTPIYKPPMHRSMFLDSVKREINAKKECHKTMGVADIKVDPKQFLRKNSRKVIKPFVEKTGKWVILIFFYIIRDKRNTHFIQNVAEIIFET